MSELDLTPIRERFSHYRDHQAHAFAVRWSCCSAHGPADDVPALIEEVERLRDANANLIRNAEILAEEVLQAHLSSGDPS